jgi:hypothetical protein
MIQRHPRNKPFTVRFPYRTQLEAVFLPNRNKGLIWYNDRSKIKDGPGAGVYGNGTKRKFSLRQYTMVFQAHVQAIKTCAADNTDRAMKIGTSIFYQIVRQ